MLSCKHPISQAVISASFLNQELRKQGLFLGEYEESLKKIERLFLPVIAGYWHQKNLIC